MLTLDKKFFEWNIIYLNSKWIVTASAKISEINFILSLFIPFAVFYLIKKPKNFLYLLLSILILASISEFMVSLLKAQFGRLRPGVITGLYLKSDAYSFPSAHAWNSMGLFTFMGLWFAKRWLFLLLISLSILIGLARFLGNNHFLFDVIFGWLGGFLLGWIYYKLLNRFIALRYILGKKEA